MTVINLTSRYDSDTLGISKEQYDSLTDDAIDVLSRCFRNYRRGLTSYEDYEFERSAVMQHKNSLIIGGQRFMY